MLYSHAIVVNLVYSIFFEFDLVLWISGSLSSACPVDKQDYQSWDTENCIIRHVLSFSSFNLAEPGS